MRSKCWAQLMSHLYFRCDRYYPRRSPEGDGSSVTLESAGNILSRTPFCSAKWLEREQEQEQEQEPGKSGGGKNRHQEQEEAPGARTGASSEGTQLEWGSCGRVPHGWGAAAKGDLRGPASDTRTAMKEGESEVQQ